ncbi:MAG: AAA family ATPase [Paracoccus sp. (in: a-proteobacteria)]|uniref:AAA family ATPase n=1 Tax=Paracoccus sp. TaxID=267 RepID=UPI0026DFC697|nr:AAA family ATPase [Paracoccus sp. (in: a-proteobacteria)]MDO5613286.1 AAA family ATPase [Paracoccus sp. (in: a-proteobacteria)]
MTPARPALPLFCPAFRAIPDPACHFMSASHRQAMTMMEFAVANNQAISLLTGDVGTGKTLLIRSFVELHRDQAHIGLIGQSGADLLNPLRWVLQAFGQDDSDAPPFELLGRLRQFLHARHAEGRKALLIADEAQSLSPEALDHLRQLADLHQDGLTLMPLFLVGDPALRVMVAAPENRALGSRIGGQVHLTPLTEQETAAYVAHRLAVAQCLCHQGAQVFDAGSLAILHQMSGGVPRIINYLAQHCLYQAAMDGRRELDADFVRNCLAGAISDGTLSHLAPWALSGADAAPVAAAGSSADLTLATQAMQQMQRWQDQPLPADPARPEAPAVQDDTPPAPVTQPQVSQAVDMAEAEPVANPTPAVDPTPSAPATAPPLPQPAPRRGRVAALGAAGALAAALAGVWLLRPGPDTAQGPAPLGTTAEQSMASAAPTPAAMTAETPAMLLAAPAVTTAPPAAVVVAEPPPLPPVIEPNAPPPPQDLFNQALTVEATDPAQAALLYARAALRGHQRAAYYLGQLYDTGVGVPADHLRAAAWYDRAPDIAAAQARLTALAETPASPTLADAPVLVMQDKLSDGRAELHWRGAAGTPRFAVEYIIAGQETSQHLETVLNAAMIDAPVARWRVTAMDAAGQPAGISAWADLTPALN